MAESLPQLTKPTRKWPAVGMFGCSKCGEISSAGGSAHWCEPEKDWLHTWDRKIKYVAEGEREESR